MKQDAVPGVPVVKGEGVPEASLLTAVPKKGHPTHPQKHHVTLELRDQVPHKASTKTES